MSIQQSSASGSLLRLAPPAVVLCDGKPHTSEVVIAPATGTFSRGSAQVGVYLGLYDTTQGRDTEATTQKQIRLRTR